MNRMIIWWNSGGESGCLMAQGKAAGVAGIADIGALGGFELKR